MTKRDEAIEAAARTYQELTEAEPFHDEPWLAAADALRAALALPPEPAAERSERERAVLDRLIEVATAEGDWPALPSIKVDLPTGRAWLTEILRSLASPHPARAETPSERERIATQRIVEAIGAEGPLSLEDAVTRVLVALEDMASLVAAPHAETPATVREDWREWAARLCDEFYYQLPENIGARDHTRAVSAALARIGPPPCAPPDEVLRAVAEAVRGEALAACIRRERAEANDGSRLGAVHSVHRDLRAISLDQIIARAKAGARHE